MAQPVDWRPFCGNPLCPCMEPDAKVCEEFVDTESGQRRCGRCGWPDYRHGVTRSGARYGRARSVFDKDRFIYYRQEPGKRLEKLSRSGWSSDGVIAESFDARLYAEGMTELEECDMEQIPPLLHEEVE